MKEKPKPTLEVASTFTKIEQKDGDNKVKEPLENVKQLVDKFQSLKERLLRAVNPLQDVKMSLKEGPEIYWHQEIKSIPPGRIWFLKSFQSESANFQ